LQQTQSGDYLLSPAYDLIDTSVHIPADSFFWLSEGLFSDNYLSESFKLHGFYAFDDFYEFGLRIGLMESRIKKILDKYRVENKKTRILIEHSYFSDTAKLLYETHYMSRLKMLNISFEKKYEFKIKKTDPVMSQSFLF